MLLPIWVTQKYPKIPQNNTNNTNEKKCFYLFQKICAIIQVLFSILKQGAIHCKCVPAVFGRGGRWLQVTLHMQFLFVSGFVERQASGLCLTVAQVSGVAS